MYGSLGAERNRIEGAECKYLVGKGGCGKFGGGARKKGRRREVNR